MKTGIYFSDVVKQFEKLVTESALTEEEAQKALEYALFHIKMQERRKNEN